MTRKFSLPPLCQWLTLMLGFIFFTSNLVVAQDSAKQGNKTVPRLGLTLVKGKVTNADGPLAGVSVMQKGASAGTTTDADGNFEIGVSGSNPQLVFSYVGYDPVEVSVSGKKVINETLINENGNLSTVVVTALGITRTTRSLGYDVGQIKGNDMDRVAQTNALNSMAGLVSGVQVNSTGATPTASVSVVIRGIRSLVGDNQPLFVIDGVPIKNTLNNIGVNNGDGNAVDYGNSISDLNPTDIENISILKGPSAAALYGSRAGNGVVLVTTKSGKKAKGLGITFTTIDQANVPYHYFPNNLSYTVGTDPYTEPNGFNSLNGVLVDLAGTDTYRFGTPLNKGLKAIQWNSPQDANGNYIAEDMVSHNNMKEFVQTGFTAINTISVENSTEKDQYHFSFTNTSDKGIVPTTGMSRNNLSLNVTHKVSNGFKLSTVLNYTRSGADNIIGGNDGVLKDVAYLSPSVDINTMKNYWLVPGIQQRKALPPVGVDQSPDVLDPADNGDNNPWFVLNTVKNGFLRNHLFGNVMANFTFSPHWTAFLRYTQDLSYESRETKMSKSNVNEINGFYGLTNIFNTESNTDFLVTYHDNVSKDFDLSASVGGNVMYSYASSNQVYSSPGGGIIAPEFFNVSNIAQQNVRYASAYYEKNINSLYATASLGFRDMAYLDLTGRNDWSSTLPESENSYFYPSASVSLLLNKIFNMSHTFNLLKLRGGWASVGKDTDPYNLYGTVGIYSFGGITTESLSGTLKNPTLKPEQAISTEIGVDLGMYNNRLRFSGTVYRSDNKNQILAINTPSSSGYTSRQINAGMVRSEGIELSLGGTIIQSRDWTWDLNVNYTKNNSYVESLADGVPYFSFWQDGPTGSWTYAKGQPIPNSFDANGKQVISDGKIGQLWDNALYTVTDKNSPYYGYPILDDGGVLQKVNNGDFQHKIVAGNFNPGLMMGIQTSVTWKFLTLFANIDMRFGGTFYSATYRYMGSDAALARQENVGIPIPDKYKNDIPAYLKSNPDAFIKITGLQQYHLVGGPSTETGGFPYTSNGNVTINDGAFYPGVYDDGNGGYTENLGNPSTTKYDNYEDAVTNGPWSFGRMDMFDASYIKLREITLSTQAPQKWVEALHVQGITFGLYMRNLIVWTKAKAGVDPELAYQYQTSPQGNGSQFRQGVERYNINPWTLQPGVKLSVHF
jgi:TonB-linked SusC/RagA family outer membrane protein